MASAGFIRVKNTGGFVARFCVTYQLNGREITQDSGDFTAGISKAIYLPPDATQIYVQIQEEYFINSWSTVETLNFATPVEKCYEIYGSTLDAHVKEIDC
ncbi:MAG: hypothetical protein AB7H80_02165 [Candidatus Kapaibacterium sp.]